MPPVTATGDVLTEAPGQTADATLPPQTFRRIPASTYRLQFHSGFRFADAADPTSLNPEVGTEEEYAQFVETLHAHGMGQVLDVVPNHMGIARSRNRWWQDVLENGPSSRYAKMFDIDWQPLKPELAHKVLLPILGDQYGTALERGEIRLMYQDGTFCLQYFDTQL